MKRLTWAAFVVLGAACSKVDGGASTVVLPSAPSATVTSPPPPPPKPKPLVPVAGYPGAYMLALGKPTRPAFGGPLSAMMVAVADGNVYFTGDNGLWSAPRSGTAPSTLLTTGFVLSLFVDATSVTYTSEKTLQRISRAGGPPTVLSTEHEDLIDLTGDGNSLFFSLFDGSPIRRLPYGGGTSTPVHPGIKSGALAVDETYLYVASYALSTVTRVAKAGGSPMAVSAATPHPVGIVVDEKNVFVTCETDGSVRRIPKAGGAVTILARGQVNHDQPAQDDTFVYWTSGGKDMAVMRVRKDGATPAEVVYTPLHTNPNQVAADDQNVYVTETGGVLVLPKGR